MRDAYFVLAAAQVSQKIAAASTSQQMQRSERSVSAPRCSTTVSRSVAGTLQRRGRRSPPCLLRLPLANFAAELSDLRQSGSPLARARTRRSASRPLPRTKGSLAAYTRIRRGGAPTVADQRSFSPPRPSISLFAFANLGASEGGISQRRWARIKEVHPQIKRLSPLKQGA